MRTGLLGIALVLVGAPGFSQAPSRSDQEKLVGAWQLASIVGPDGKPVVSGKPVGMLIYTHDGHMSVQLMYPRSESSLSNEYVQNGYEASFGSYDVNPVTHTITHHVEGANTGDKLVGKDLPRLYHFDSTGRLIIKSAKPDERWSVTWQQADRETTHGSQKKEKK